MNTFKKIAFLSLIVLTNACSTRKDNFVSRNYHGVTTKYNVLYNGNIALDKGIAELNVKNEDNFWEILPIESLEITDELLNADLQNEKPSKTSLDIAEEKAVKAVQKHGMNIGGSEKNKQIDDAYLLLGKARYYSLRFIPALESFDYSLKTNPKSDLNVVLKIWKAKTLVRLQNEEAALNELQLLLKNKEVKKEEKEEIHTALAMTYLALDSIKPAIKQLNNAVETDEYKEQHARNLFILGQLYSSTNEIDSAKWAFDKVLNYKKADNKYKIHAHLEKIQLTENENELNDLENQLKKMAKNPVNSKYNDEIYFGLASINQKLKNEEKMLGYLNKTLKINEVKKYQKVLTYEKLGDFYFEKSDFVLASKYYDSILPNVENANTKHIRKIERKINNLEDVVFYENVLKENDSILNLLSLNDNDKKLFFEKYVEKLKKSDEKRAIKEENAKANQGVKNNLSASQKGNWYFYNPQTLGFGKQEFQRIWGKRELKDNWRWENNSSDLSSKENSDSKVKNKRNDSNIDPRYDVNTYLSSIPKGDKVSKIKEEKSNALYQLGLIYKEKFSKFDLAQVKLERFLKEEPKEKLVLPAKYHLYKIYEKSGNPLMKTLRTELETNYPDSRYVAMLKNSKDFNALDSLETPEKHYEKVYCEYEYEQYDWVFNECEKAIKQYVDEPIQPKFELLKAYSLYHIKGKTAFVDGLEFVINNFPKTEEAIHAQDVLDRMNGVVKKETIKQLPTNTETKQLPKGPEKNIQKVEPLNEDEKRQKVLQMMKDKGDPNMEQQKDFNNIEKKGK